MQSQRLRNGRVILQPRRHGAADVARLIPAANKYIRRRAGTAHSFAGKPSKCLSNQSANTVTSLSMPGQPWPAPGLTIK